MIYDICDDMFSDEAEPRILNPASLSHRFWRSTERPSSLRWTRTTLRVAGWRMEWRSSSRWRRGSTTSPSGNCTASPSLRPTGATPGSTPSSPAKTGAPCTSESTVSPAGRLSPQSDWLYYRDYIWDRLTFRKLSSAVSPIFLNILGPHRLFSDEWCNTDYFNGCLYLFPALHVTLTCRSALTWNVSDFFKTVKLLFSVTILCLCNIGYIWILIKYLRIKQIGCKWSRRSVAISCCWRKGNKCSFDLDLWKHSKKQKISDLLLKRIDNRRTFQ